MKGEKEWKEEIENYLEPLEVIMKKLQAEVEKILAGEKRKQNFFNELFEKQLENKINRFRKAAPHIVKKEEIEKRKINNFQEDREWREADSFLQYLFSRDLINVFNAEDFVYDPPSDNVFFRSIEGINSLSHSFSQFSFKIALKKIKQSSEKCERKKLLNKELIKKKFAKHRFEFANFEEKWLEKENDDYQLYDSLESIWRREMMEKFFLPFPLAEDYGNEWEKRMMEALEKWTIELKSLKKFSQPFSLSDNKNNAYKLDMYRYAFNKVHTIFYFFLGSCSSLGDKEWIQFRSKKAFEHYLSFYDEEKLEIKKILKKEEFEKQFKKNFTFFWQIYFFSQRTGFSNLTFYLNNYYWGEYFFEEQVCQNRNFLSELEEKGIKVPNDVYDKFVIFPSLIGIDFFGKRKFTGGSEPFFIVREKSKIKKATEDEDCQKDYINNSLYLTEEESENLKKNDLSAIFSQWIIFHSDALEKSGRFVSLIDENSQYQGPIMVDEDNYLIFKKYCFDAKTGRRELTGFTNNLNDIEIPAEELFSLSLGGIIKNLEKISLKEYIDYLNQLQEKDEEKLSDNELKIDRENAIYEPNEEGEDVFFGYPVINQKKWREFWEKEEKYSSIDSTDIASSKIAERRKKELKKSFHLKFPEKFHFKLSNQNYLIRDSDVANLLNNSLIKHCKKEVFEEWWKEGIRGLNFIDGSGGTYGSIKEAEENRIRDWTIFPFVELEKEKAWIAINKSALESHFEQDLYYWNSLTINSGLANDPLNIQQLIESETEGEYFYWEKGEDESLLLTLNQEEMEFKEAINEEIILKADSLKDLAKKIEKTKMISENKKENEEKLRALVAKGELAKNNLKTPDKLENFENEIIGKLEEYLKGLDLAEKKAGWEKLTFIKYRKKIEKFRKVAKKSGKDKDISGEPIQENEFSPNRETTELISDLKKHEEPKITKETTTTATKESNSSLTTSKRSGKFFFIILAVLVIFVLGFWLVAVFNKKKKKT